MKHPGRKWKQAAIARFHSGDTIRTDRFRFTSYADARGKFLARVLYNHHCDPGEDINISERPKQKDVVRNLAK